MVIINSKHIIGGGALSELCCPVVNLKLVVLLDDIWCVLFFNGNLGELVGHGEHNMPYLEGEFRSCNIFRWTLTMALLILVASEGCLVGSIVVNIICGNIKG